MKRKLRVAVPRDWFPGCRVFWKRDSRWYTYFSGGIVPSREEEVEGCIIVDDREVEMRGEYPSQDDLEKIAREVVRELNA